MLRKNTSIRSTRMEPARKPNLGRNQVRPRLVVHATHSVQDSGRHMAQTHACGCVGAWPSNHAVHVIEERHGPLAVYEGISWSVGFLSWSTHAFCAIQ